MWNSYSDDAFVSCSRLSRFLWNSSELERTMNGIIYLVGLVVVVMAILSFFGMH
jgi:hypothetical protein